MGGEPEILRSSDEDNEAIHQNIRRYNRKYMREIREYNFHIEENGETVAGIVACSTFKTLEVEFLFVAEGHRGEGLGSRLLRYTEELARKDGMRMVLLNTYSFQAPGFYKKMGYTELFKIDPCLGEFSQYYYVKYLAPEDTAE